MHGDIIANPLDSSSDALESFVLEECVKRRRINHDVSALITPASRCETGIKLARLGAAVTILDRAEQRLAIEGRILAAGFRDQMQAISAPDLNIEESLPGEPFDLILVRRGISALPYAEARATVKRLLRRLKIGGKLYLSVFGRHSELAEGYLAADLSIADRYAPLAPKIAEKYGQSGSFCLYSERELFMLLLEAKGSVLRTLTTTYGNVQGVAVRV